MLKFGEICVFLKKPSRDRIWHQFLHFWAPLLASRDPVGIQSGSSRAPNFRIFGTTFGPVGKQPKSPKNAQKHCKNVIFYEFGSRHWCPTGSRLAKSGAQKCKNWCPTGSRRDPNEIPTGSIDRKQKTENSKAVTSKHRAVFFDCQKVRGSRPGVFFSACCCALPKKTCFDPGLDMKG